MFKSEYQGGVAFEVLTTQGSTLPKHWKFQKPLKKIYDKELKGFYFPIERVYQFNLDSTANIPKDVKTTIHLMQPGLVLQVFVPKGGKVTIEFLLRDMKNNHKRFFFSTLLREEKITALHASFPLVTAQNQWENLVFDLPDLMSQCFRGATLQSIGFISVGGNLRLRKVFTLKRVLNVVTGPFALDDGIPANLNFPVDVNYLTTFINLESLRSKHCGRNTPNITPPTSGACITGKGALVKQEVPLKVPAKAAKNQIAPAAVKNHHQVTTVPASDKVVNVSKPIEINKNASSSNQTTNSAVVGDKVKTTRLSEDDEKLIEEETRKSMAEFVANMKAKKDSDELCSKSSSSTSSSPENEDIPVLIENKEDIEEESKERNDIIESYINRVMNDEVGIEREYNAYLERMQQQEVSNAIENVANEGLAGQDERETLQSDEMASENHSEVENEEDIPEELPEEENETELVTFTSNTNLPAPKASKIPLKKTIKSVSQYPAPTEQNEITTQAYDTIAAAAEIEFGDVKPWEEKKELEPFTRYLSEQDIQDQYNQSLVSDDELDEKDDNLYIFNESGVKSPLFMDKPAAITNAPMQ